MVRQPELQPLDLIYAVNPNLPAVIKWRIWIYSSLSFISVSVLGQKSLSSDRQCGWAAGSCLLSHLDTPVSSLSPSSLAGRCWTPTPTTRWTSWRTGRTSSRTWWCTTSSVARMKSRTFWLVIKYRREAWFCLFQSDDSNNQGFFFFLRNLFIIF